MSEPQLPKSIDNIRHGAEPTTPTEAYLEKLCRKSFLSLWSYPRVFNDKKDNPKARHGKEIVDLMVVFADHVILFSDKSCEFPNSGDLKIDWSRWKKKSIDKSIDQLYGAERWLRQFPDRAFIDPECSKKLPIQFPCPATAHFHRIAIANGAKARCIDALGGIGSLMIASDNAMELPFMAAQPVNSKGFVHILDETSLDILMHELDTITDFVQYLEKKEFLFKSVQHCCVAGEEELLGSYLRDVNQQGDHDFKIPANADAISIDVGFWDSFLQSNARRSRIEADRCSYAWDKIIETFNYHALTNTLFNQSLPGIQNHERIVRHLAAEPRTRRRVLMESLYDLLEKTPKGLRSTRLFTNTENKYPTYVFLLLPRKPELSRDEYRRMRQYLLSAYCTVAPLVDTNVGEIIGFATETNDGNPERSEDLLYYDARNMTDEDVDEARTLQKDLELFMNVQCSESHASEYPISDGYIGGSSLHEEKRRTRNRKKRARRQMR